MSETLAQRAALADLPQGWFHHGEKILDLVEQHRPLVCVELGTWLGASAIALARTIRPWGGTLTCVDTWTGSVDQTPTQTPGRPTMLASCAANLVEAGVANRVRLIPSTTLAAAECWTGPIDFLYIDADHAFESVVADLEAWIPHVRSGGLIAGDDYGNPFYPGVRMAWNYVEHAHDLPWQRFSTPHTKPPGMQLVYGFTP